jgi:hypothetical protein
MLVRSLHALLAVAGAVMLLVLIRTIGLSSLRNVGSLGLALGGAIAFELVLDLCNALGWRAALGDTPVGYWRLFWIRQAGTAVNQLTPTASLGGEVVKTTLLRTSVPTATVLASLITAKATLVGAQATIVLLGFAALLARSTVTPGLTLGVAVGLVVSAGGALALLLVQRHGLFTRVVDAAARLLPPLRAVLDRVRAGAVAVDRNLVTLSTRHPYAVARSFGWHFAGQLASLGQLMFVLVALDAGVSTSTALILEAGAVVTDSLAFFVPARLGVLEGGRVLVFTALGLAAADGLAAALVIRVTQVAVAATGLAALAYFSLTRAPLTAGSTSGSS